MKKKEQYIKIKSLSVSKILFDFENNELLKGINIKKINSGMNLAKQQKN